MIILEKIRNEQGFIVDIQPVRTGTIVESNIKGTYLQVLDGKPVQSFTDRDLTFIPET